MKPLLLCLALTLPAQDDVDALIQKLRSEKIEERDAAAKKLTELGDAARPALQALRKDPDRGLGARAASILGEIGTREKTRRFLVPAKRATASARLLPLPDAAEKVFGPFGLILQRRGDFTGDLGIALVTVDVKDAPFWESVDRFCAVAKVAHNAIGLGDARVQKLGFLETALPAAWDTLGDLRVFAVAFGGKKAGEVLPRFWIACPPWAVPKGVGIDRVSVSGWPGDAAVGRPLPEVQPLPSTAGLMTVAPLPVTLPAVARESLKDAETVDAEGVLRITTGDEKGKEDILVPFAIRGIPLPLR